MISILTDSTHSKILYSESTTEEIKLSEQILNNKFKAENSIMRFSPAVKKGFVNPYKNFYIEDKNLLPTGFVPFLEEYYKQADIDYQLQELQDWPQVDKAFIKELLQGNYSENGFAPRDYQVKSAFTLVKNRGGIIQLSMGSGKSYIAFLLCKIYKQHKILMLFDSIDLIHQTRKYFIDYGLPEEEIGVIQGANFQDDKRVTLLSVASYEKAFHLFPEIKILIVDECHELGSEVEGAMSTKVLYSCQNASVRIGLSATADAIDNPYRQMGLYGNLGPIVYSKDILEQVEAGVLAQLNVEMYTVNGDIRINGSYADVYNEEKELEQRGDESTHYVFNESRNLKIAGLAKVNSRVMILFNRIDHGKELKKLLPDAILVTGDDDKKTREEAKEYLRDHKDNILLASTIFGQGVDIPWIETLILAGGGKGTVPVIQRFGRATRKNKEIGKVSAKVIDFADKFSPLAIKQSKKRQKIYEDKLGFPCKIII